MGRKWHLTSNTLYGLGSDVESEGGRVCQDIAAIIARLKWHVSKGGDGDAHLLPKTTFGLHVTPCDVGAIYNSIPYS